MESKKDIGNYFKENLKQLDYSPSEKVWDKIKIALKQQKKRRFIFWLFFTTITIGTILLYINSYHFNSLKPKINNVVTTDTNNVNGNNTNAYKTNNVKNPNSLNTNSDIDVTNKTDINNANRHKENNTSNGNQTNSGNDFIDYENNKASKNDMSKSGTLDINKKSKKVSTKSHSVNAKSKKSSKVRLNNNILKNSSSKNARLKKVKTGKNLNSVRANNPGEKQSKKDKNSEALDQLNALKVSNTSEENQKLDNSDNNNNTTFDVLETSKTTTALANANDKKTSLDELKKSNQKKRDSIIAVSKAEEEKNTLSQNPKDEEQKDTTTTKVVEEKYQISIAPYFGINYTGNFGNGNFLNDDKTSKKVSESNTSYGVLIRVMGSEKVGLQIGAGIINSSYSATFEKTNNSFINSNSATLEIPLSEINALFPTSTKTTSTIETTFIEVPLEAYYIFSDKKFGFATSFGISFLKLQNNELFLESDTVARLKIGKLENIVPFSSSINIKLNFFYKITSKLNFDLYPSFQYHFMGFKDVSNYHPYFFSIKTGLSYKL